VGDPEPPATRKEIFEAVKNVAPLGLLILVTIGSMYMGLVTPTEASALGFVLALLISIAMGGFTVERFFGALRRTILITGNILFIVSAAYVFSHAMSLSGVGEKLTTFMTSLNLNRVEFFIALIVLFTILGCLVESVGMIVVTVPLLFPILPLYGIDPIWFGVAVVFFVELGQISPPIGINLFVIQSIWNGKFKDVVLGTVPFHILMIVLLVMIMIWPQIVLWLPSRM
jgi:tripartite ATP-independent transporter DctM subunit